jgi:hypothetical protein
VVRKDYYDHREMMMVVFQIPVDVIAIAEVDVEKPKVGMIGIGIGKRVMKEFASDVVVDIVVRLPTFLNLL